MKMAARTCRVGLHGRNYETFEEVDYQIVREARIETLKMMSQTQPDVFKRLKSENPDIEFIVRLWDDRMGVGRHPTPEQFVERMVPIMQGLRPFAAKFEIHNEPNHLQRYEGWGQDDADARDFNQWYQQVFKLLKQRCPWALLGFPGLAIPHRDLEWVEICRPAVEMSDFLGVHCYWQTTPQEPRNHLANFWGLRFKYYHDKFPGKVIDLLEVGNSNAQSGLPITDAEIARQIVEYFQELFKYPYLNSASPFIMSSPDPTWDSFAWRKVSGEVKPVVASIRAMPRPPLQPVVIRPLVRERFFEPTQQTVSGPFLDFFDKYGLDICGYPISSPASEDGLQVQYFQRIVMEEFQPDQIRLRLAGTQVLDLRRRVQELEQQLAAPRADDQVAALQARIAELEQQLAAPRADGQVAALQARIAELEQQLAAARAATDQATGVVAQPAITDVIDALAKHPTQRYQTRPVSKINSIVLHHSAVPASVGADRIAKYQVEKQGWPGAGFHYFVYDDGRIEQTQPLEAIAYHAGDANPISAGICLAGNFTQQPPADAQLLATSQLTAWLLQKLNLPIEAIHSHKDYVATACPGDQWDAGAKWGERLRRQVQDALAGAGPVVTTPAGKPLGHYMLFWQTPDDWAKDDFLGAQNYIGRFRVTAGFSVDDAMQAEYVTIVGGPLGVSPEAEALLRAAGCKVDRVAGDTFAETKRLLDQMAEEGKRFLSF
jgi:hypothetical protein